MAGKTRSQRQSDAKKARIASKARSGISDVLGALTGVQSADGSFGLAPWSVGLSPPPFASYPREVSLN